MMHRTDPVLHRSHSATWYAWGRVDQARESRSNLEKLLHANCQLPAWVDLVDVFEFGERCATEAREYHDPKHPRSHLASIPDQWHEYLHYLTGE